jgi:hypothetical protein
MKISRTGSSRDFGQVSAVVYSAAPHFAGERRSEGGRLMRSAERETDLRRRTGDAVGHQHPEQGKEPKPAVNRCRCEPW